MTPLRIADKYRLTEEVTPAGTILAVTLSSTILFSGYLATIFSMIQERYQMPDYLKRLLPITLILLSIMIGWKPAIQEMKNEHKERDNSTSRARQPQSFHSLEDMWKGGESSYVSEEEDKN